MSEVPLSLTAELSQGFKYVSEILDAENSTLLVDPLLKQLAARVEESSKTIAIGVIENGLRLGEFSAIREIAQYFAFRFKWHELKIDVERLLAEAHGSRDLRKARSLATILDAFRDDWEDVDLFPSLQVGRAQP